MIKVLTDEVATLHWFNNNPVVHCPLSSVRGDNSLTPPSSTSRFARLFRLAQLIKAYLPLNTLEHCLNRETKARRISALQCKIMCHCFTATRLSRSRKSIFDGKVVPTCRDSKCRSWERSWGARGCLLVLGKSETQSRWESEKQRKQYTSCTWKTEKICLAVETLCKYYPINLNLKH